MTAREQEMTRLRDAVNSIVDPQRLLFVCLTGADPKDARRLIYAPFDDVGGKIPESFKDRAQALYKIAGSELDKCYSPPLCRVIEDFLRTLLPHPPLYPFTYRTPLS